MLQRDAEAADAICQDYSVRAPGPQAIRPTRSFRDLKSPRRNYSFHGFMQYLIQRIPTDVSADSALTYLAWLLLSFTGYVLDGPKLAGFLQPCRFSAADAFQSEANRKAFW